MELKDKKEEIDYKINSGIRNLVVIFVCFFLVTIVYVYFNVQVINAYKNKPTVYQNALAVVYIENNKEQNNYIIPGDTITKTFNVENYSKNTVKYDLYWSCVQNTFKRTEDLTYTLTSTNNGGEKTSTVIPTKSKEDVLTGLIISAKSTQNYTLTITYNKLEKINQSIDRTGTFDGKINVLTKGQTKTSEC